MEFVSPSRDIQITVKGLTSPESKFEVPNKEVIVFQTAEIIKGIYDENLGHILESPCPSREEDLVKIARIKRDIIKSCFNDCYRLQPETWLNNIVLYYVFTQISIHNFGEIPFVLGDAIVIDLSADECLLRDNPRLERDCPRDVRLVVSNLPATGGLASFSPMQITMMASVDEIKHVYHNCLGNFDGNPVESKEQAREKLVAKLLSSVFPCLYDTYAINRDAWLGNVLVLYSLDLISQTNYGEIPFVVKDVIEMDMSRFVGRRK